MCVHGHVYSLMNYFINIEIRLNFITLYMCDTRSVWSISLLLFCCYRYSMSIHDNATEFIYSCTTVIFRWYCRYTILYLVVVKILSQQRFTFFVRIFKFKISWYFGFIVTVRYDRFTSIFSVV